jgi:uncharacterized protein
MKKITIYYDKKQKLKDPILVVGLPGIGNVGSLVAEHIKNELKGKRLGILYSAYFPHQAIMLPSGSLRMVSNRFYHCKTKSGRSIVVLVGDTQPQSTVGQYAVNSRIVKFVKNLGCKTIYTIGGYANSNQYVSKPKVFGVSNNKELKTELTKAGVIFGKAAGTIWGAAGMIPALSKHEGINAACIMGETGMLEIDANSAKAVLEMVKKPLGIDLAYANLDKIKKETDKIMKDLEANAAAQQPQEGFPPATKESVSYIR